MTDRLPRLAILAGRGSLPVSIAEAAAARGRDVFIVGIGGEADEAIKRFPHINVRWGAIGALLRALKGDGQGDGGPRPAPPEMVIAGGVRRPDLKAIKPDLGFFSSLPSVLPLLRGGDDAVLTRVVKFFEAQGLTVRGVHEVAPELVLGDEALGAFDPRGLTGWADAEPRLGLDVMATLGDLDIGQAIVVRGRDILGIEGAEGTDALLARVAALQKEGGAGSKRRAGVLVKAPKPGQELRVDLPSIGAETVRRVDAAGLAGIAAAAGVTLALERTAMIEHAHASGTFIAGLPIGQARVRRVPAITRERLEAQGLARRASADAARAADTVARLAPFNTGHVAIAVGRHVLTVSAIEPALAAVSRTKALRQWGMDGLTRGAIAIRADTGGRADDQLGAIASAAADMGLATFIALGAWPEAALAVARSESRIKFVALESWT